MDEVLLLLKHSVLLVCLCLCACVLAGAEWMSCCSTPPAFLPPALRTLFHTALVYRNLPSSKEKRRKRAIAMGMAIVMVQVTVMVTGLSDLRSHEEGLFLIFFPPFPV